MKLSRGVLAALAALMIAAPTAFAADDPVGDPTGVECVAADGGACTDPGGSVEDPPSTGGDDQSDTPGDPGSSDGSGGDQGGGSDSTGDDTTTTDPSDPTDGSDKPGDGSGDDSGGSDPGKGDGDPTGIDLCSWEPWNCDGWTPPNCRPTANGTKICLPIVDPPVVDPNCKTDPDTGEAYCWQPPEICLVSRFASEADAAAAGCLPPPCVVAADGTVDCGGGGEPYCPDCETPYPPPLCQVAEGANGETWCVRPPPCFIDDEGNKICAVYDFSPGESRGGDPTSEDDTVGVCVIGVDSPCNGKPEPRKGKGKGKNGGKANGGVKAGPRKGTAGPKRKGTTPKRGNGSTDKGSSTKGGTKSGKPATKKPRKKSTGANNPKGQSPKKSGAKKPKRSAKR